MLLPSHQDVAVRFKDTQIGYTVYRSLKWSAIGEEPSGVQELMMIIQTWHAGALRNLAYSTWPHQEGLSGVGPLTSHRSLSDHHYYEKAAKHVHVIEATMLHSIGPCVTFVPPNASPKFEGIQSSVN
jgi:hypothetical protein